MKKFKVGVIGNGFVGEAISFAFSSVSDGRIGDSHLNVPGHDGKLGYGGTCFPKNINALLSFSKKHDIQLNTIKWVGRKGRPVCEF